jgi:hypothetical protein
LAIFSCAGFIVLVLGPAAHVSPAFIVIALVGWFFAFRKREFIFWSDDRIQTPYGIPGHPFTEFITTKLKDIVLFELRPDSHRNERDKTGSHFEVVVVRGDGYIFPVADKIGHDLGYMIAVQLNAAHREMRVQMDKDAVAAELQKLATIRAAAASIPKTMGDRSRPPTLH